MDASKLTNGSGPEVLTESSVPPAKSAQPNAVRAETKRVTKKATGKKIEAERATTKSTRSSKSEKLVCRYCGSKDLAPSFIKRRDRRCRKCFSQRYGARPQTQKAKAKK